MCLNAPWVCCLDSCKSVWISLNFRSCRPAFRNSVLCCPDSLYAMIWYSLVSIHQPPIGWGFWWGASLWIAADHVLASLRVFLKKKQKWMTKYYWMSTSGILKGTDFQVYLVNLIFIIIDLQSSQYTITRQYDNKNTRVGFLRTQITWVKPYHLSAKCNVAWRWWVRNEGYLGPQKTDDCVFIFILY